MTLHVLGESTGDVPVSMLRQAWCARSHGRVLCLALNAVITAMMYGMDWA